MTPGKPRETAWPLAASPSAAVRLRARGRAALAWGLAGFACVQIALALAVESWRPELRDPEYGHKLASLKKELADEPGRPLVVALGSSRLAMGLRPHDLPPCGPAGGPEPLVFNFALMGGGPTLDLLSLHRLLAQGIRPDGVVVECWPPLWNASDPLIEENVIAENRLSAGDVSLLRHYWTRPRLLYQEWCQSRLSPWFSLRFVLMAHYLPGWLPMETRREWTWQAADDSGWLHSPFADEAAERAHRLLVTRTQYESVLQQFRISATADRATRELLAVCRRQGIHVAMLLMPESKEFQGLYPPAVRGQADDYFQRLGREYGVPLIDARDWSSDADFLDGYHLFPRAATTFTRRFGHEVLRPLLDGSLRAQEGK